MTKPKSSIKTGICTVTLGRGPCQGWGFLPLKVTEFSSTRLTLPNRHNMDRTMTRQGKSMMSSESGVMTMSTESTALHGTDLLGLGMSAALSPMARHTALHFDGLVTSGVNETTQHDNPQCLAMAPETVDPGEQPAEL